MTYVYAPPSDEVVLILTGGSTVHRLRVDTVECDHCGAPASWRYELRATAATTTEGAFCSILCRDRAARWRELGDTATTIPAPPDDGERDESHPGALTLTADELDDFFDD